MKTVTKEIMQNNLEEVQKKLNNFLLSTHILGSGTEKQLYEKLIERKNA